MAAQQPTIRKIKRYGWIPDLPDARDHLFAAPPAVLGKLPASVDLEPRCPPVYDQGQLGSCTGNAIAAAIQFDRMKQGQAQAEKLVPSLLQRARHRRQRRPGFRCADPRWREVRREARSVLRERRQRLAV